MDTWLRIGYSHGRGATVFCQPSMRESILEPPDLCFDTDAVSGRAVTDTTVVAWPAQSL